ncbi:MAG: hypothetical protein DWQ31_06665 [Planctomycetota bacterium]|nr:MAG: hypothetical protein DWQ31_06665 [Planctomycetota bacterium]REJ90342.1 MAG: hypothetical protein DWQ35_16840 [Planctomycetota bacterium]
MNFRLIRIVLIPVFGFLLGYCLHLFFRGDDWMTRVHMGSMIGFGFTFVTIGLFGPLFELEVIGKRSKKAFERLTDRVGMTSEGKVRFWVWLVSGVTFVVAAALTRTEETMVEPWKVIVFGGGFVVFGCWQLFRTYYNYLQMIDLIRDDPPWPKPKD